VDVLCCLVEVLYFAGSFAFLSVFLYLVGHHFRVPVDALVGLEANGRHLVDSLFVDNVAAETVVPFDRIRSLAITETISCKRPSRCTEFDAGRTNHNE